MTETKTAVNKSTWGPGPWQNEPDRKDFIHRGFACFINRGPHGGWCGYVGVPSEHPAYGKDYDDIDVEVHGGLTYAGKCQGELCHVPEPGMPDDVWWLGFDCAHSGDISPAFDCRCGLHEWETYKDLEYASAETRSLAEQLAALSKT